MISSYDNVLLFICDFFLTGVLGGILYCLKCSSSFELYISKTGKGITGLYTVCLIGRAYASSKSESS